jgi:hypothetical protein
VSRKAIPNKDPLIPGSRFAKGIRRIFRQCGAPKAWGDLEAKFLYDFICTIEYTNCSLFWFEWDKKSVKYQHPVELILPVRLRDIPDFLPLRTRPNWETNDILKAFYFMRLYSQAYFKMPEILFKISRLRYRDFRSGQATAVSQIIGHMEHTYDWMDKLNDMPLAKPEVLSKERARAREHFRFFWEGKELEVAEYYKGILGTEVTCKIIQKARRKLREIRPFRISPDSSPCKGESSC